MIEFENKDDKDQKQYKILYNWLRIARKPKFSLVQDIQLLMDLIQIPITKSQLKFLIKIVDPQGKKQQLQQNDLANCFTVLEEKKKPKQKQLNIAFRHIAEGEEQIQIQKLRQCLEQQGLDQYSSDLLLKQLCQYQVDDGKFNYQKFISEHMEK